MAPLLMIDPGHGGIDPGGGSSDLFTEKDMTLQISLYQYRRFQELNIPVAMTRVTDTTLGNEERASIVRNSGAKYCISNHINSGGGRGAEAIYSIYASSALPIELVQGLELAGMPTRRVFTRTYPGNPKLDYYFMHRETGNVETVILEYGFIDNPVDAQKIFEDWKELAESVVRSFAEFANYPYQPPRPAPNPNPGNNIPDWKQEAIDWMYKEGLLTNEDWRKRIDEPLPLWAEAIILRRLFEKLQK